MQTSSTGGIELQLSKRPGDASRISLAKDAKKSLNKYSFLLVPGIFGGLLAWVIYPPLDAGPFVALGMCVLLLPMLLQLRSSLVNRLEDDIERLQKAYVYSSIALAVLASMLLLNGWFDKSPQTVMKAILVQKTVTRGRGAQHILTVASWRPGRRTENFYVSSIGFNRFVLGKTIRVQLHRGFFGLPWSGNILPE
jgi:hypothetical protein